jgi:hypothetical protein
VQTPVSRTSVVGIARSIQVIPVIFEGDSMLLFEGWSDGELNATRTFAAQEDTVTYTALFKKYAKGKGTGIRGYFYDSPPFDPTFYEPFKFTRIDATIDFDWGGGSPDPAELGADYWLVRWEGFIEPLFDDLYDFHVVADDGIRLWVDHQMIIDAWIPQPPTEWIGTIALERGKYYPLKLEYFEEGGGALCRLSWSSVRIPTAIVPQSQLYPESPTAVLFPGTIPVRAYPNPVTDFLRVELDSDRAAIAHFAICNSLGQLVRHQDVDFISSVLTIDARDLPTGMHWLKCWTSSGEYILLSFIKA